MPKGSKLRRARFLRARQRRRPSDLEDAILLGYGSRTPLVIDILVDRLRKS